MGLESWPSAYRAAVFGSSGAIGTAFVNALCADPRCTVVYAGARREFALVSTKVRAFRFSLEDEGSIQAAIDCCAADGPLHLVLVATGMLHDTSVKPEKSWRALAPDSLSRAFAVNAIGPALIGKHALSHLATVGKSAFVALSARVGSISDNRLGGWHAYRASKAALNMFIRTFAIELAARNRSAICVGLHPGTVESALSQPFLAGVKPAQIFSPAYSAECLLRVLDGLSPVQSGRLFAWDGSEIGF